MSGEKEWRVIPGFPKYEMTYDGEVRTVKHKADVTFRPLAEDSGMTISLFQEGGLVEKDIRGLIYTTFPEFTQVSSDARLRLVRRFAEEMQHWLGGEYFLYTEFEHLAEIVIDEGWRLPDE